MQVQESSWRAASLPALAGLLFSIWCADLSGLLARLDAAAFDCEARLARLAWPVAAAPAPDPEVVIVGIDDASLDALGVPLAMIHADLGRALEAIAAAGPRLVGIDIALPARSFDPLLPGLDRELMRGLLAVRAAAGLVIAIDADAQGGVRVPPLALVAAAGGSQAFGLPFFPLDCDGVVRRFDPDPGWARAPPSCRPDLEAPQVAPLLPTFAARMADALGRGQRLRAPAWIDFSRGAPFGYTPLKDVLAWQAGGDAAQLRARFAGRIVLVGSVLPFLDRLDLPVPLAAWQPAQAGVPGVVVNAQLMRNVAGGGLLHSLPPAAGLLVALLLCGLAALRSSGTRAVGWLLALLGLLAGGAALQFAGAYFAPAQALLAGVVAIVLRGAQDGMAFRRERGRLAQLLGAYVGVPVREALLRARSGAPGTRRALALMFADLRGFTAWSEAADAGLVHDTLNRYYQAITPVLQRHGGTIDNFRGDGIMVMFGAPVELAQPCAAALAGARELVAAVEAFSAAQVERGAAPLAVTVGMAYGEVVFGELGSAERRDYTALGDAVNVAARLQALARRLGTGVLMTQDFARQLPPGETGLRDLGAQAIDGHSPVAVCAWEPRLPVAC